MYPIPAEAAGRALALWNSDAGSLAHIATSGNAVYRFAEGGTPRILRLTHPSHRAHPHTEAELAFLRHLSSAGVRVNAPVPSRAGRDAEQVDGFSACVLTWTPGIVVTADSPEWDEAFFREWGRSLGAIHRAARDYGGPPRWEWTDEYLIADALAIFPADDAPVRAEFERVMAALTDLPRTRETYGMIHADYAPGNFHYVPGDGIHAFDFGNCCGHWFLSDIAISLSVLRRRPERDQLRAWLLAGYHEAFPIDRALLAHLDTFIQLRILYVLLSRLEWFGPNPDAAQRETLDLLRRAVLDRFTWPLED
jgi:Ser/Thr protein kinase RdoA (MazF antagonist)